jgi:hypothetical protein
MPDHQFGAALRDSVSVALEEMFFACDLEECGADEGLSRPDLAMRVDFTGEPSGWLALHAGLGSVRTLAADFLGEDQEAISDGQAADVFAELTNIICGGVLTRAESKSTFRLSSPRLVAWDEAARDEREASGSAGGADYAVSLMDGPLTARLRTEVGEWVPTVRSAS